MDERQSFETALQQFLEAAPDAMLIVDADGRVVQANAHLLGLFG